MKHGVQRAAKWIAGEKGQFDKKKRDYGLPPAAREQYLKSFNTKVVTAATSLGHNVALRTQEGISIVPL